MSTVIILAQIAHTHKRTHTHASLENEDDKSPNWESRKGNRTSARNNSQECSAVHVCMFVTRIE